VPVEPDGARAAGQRINPTRGEPYVTQVIWNSGESFESMMRRFKRVCQEDGILSEVRQRRFFEKPSQVRKRKKAAKLRKSRRSSRKAAESVY